MIELSALGWAALAVAAALVGFAKTAIAGAAAIPVVLFALVLPARESTGALLPLLIVGDVVAVSLYRRHADWGTLLRMFPAVALGILVGFVFVARVSDVGMRRTIGGVLLVLVAVHLWQRRRERARAPAGAAGVAEGPVPREPAPSGPAAADVAPVEPSDGAPAAPLVPAGRRTALPYGLLAGFTTMVANAAGPVMALYLLSARKTMLGFLGTAAWFFLIVNVSKVPLSSGLGLITAQSLLLDAVLVPALLVGAGVGRALIGRLDQQRFETLILAFTVLASLNLLR